MYIGLTLGQLISLLMSGGSAYDACAIFRTLRNPLYWLMTRKDLRLEADVLIVAAIVERDGIRVPRLPKVRRMHARLRTHPVLACCFPEERLILASHEVAEANERVRLWVVAHEMAHYLDFVFRRRGCWLFEILRGESSERFADGIAWYCWYRLAYLEAKIPFDWFHFMRDLDDRLDLRNPLTADAPE